jgi:hypothetical protein
MESHRYRVILKGDLHPGFSRDAAIAAMAEVFQTNTSVLRGVFDGVERPVNQRLSAEGALELQDRLERIGVRCRIERMPEQNIELQLREGLFTDQGTEQQQAPDGMMSCPACGHRQLMSNRCDACGVVFAEYRADGRVSAAAGQPAPVNRPQPSPHPSMIHDDWRNDWLDNGDEAAPDEMTYLAMFFGPQSEAYLDHCDRCIRGAETRFRLSWNWAAVISPFMWALYRKLWGWSAVMFVTEILLPLLLIILGSYGIGSPSLALGGYLLLLLNRVTWPLVVNWLYCRHARVTLERLHMMSPNYAAEVDIRTTGGVSGSASFVGLAVGAVLCVFVWSVVDSVHDTTVEVSMRQSLDQKGAGLLEDRVGMDAGDMPGPGGTDGQLENKWIATRSQLRSLGQKVNERLTRSAAGADTSQVSLYRLREELNLEPDALRDAWGGEVQYIPDAEGYRLISAGPDRLFGTADDLQYRRVMTE